MSKSECDAHPQQGPLERWGSEHPQTRPLTFWRRHRCRAAKRFSQRFRKGNRISTLVAWLGLAVMGILALAILTPPRGPISLVYYLGAASAAIMLMAAAGSLHNRKINAVLDLQARYRDGRPWFCAKCSYPFKGAALADNRCPECGEAFEHRPKGSRKAR